jgi:prepilin-type N-terminal cleavage/methylation domain-containing protein
MHPAERDPRIKAPRRKPGDRPGAAPKRTPGDLLIQAPKRKLGDRPPIRLEAPPGKAGPAPLEAPRAFTLTELLVVISIVLVLMGLLSAAVAGARGSAKRLSTKTFIDKLDAVIQEQYARYDSIAVPLASIPASIANKAAGRAWFIRRNYITGDLPDRWSDVEFMTAQSGTAGQFPLDRISGSQRAYIGFWNSLNPKPTAQYQGAECLFMIINVGGIADCLDCGDLRGAARGDKDRDGAPEFWDEWSNPIGYLLWPAALELPIGTRFFSAPDAPVGSVRQLSVPFPATGSPPPGLGMRPLVYSAGPDGEYGFETNNTLRNLDTGDVPSGLNCGDCTKSPTSTYGGRASDPDYRADNITNFDDEAK